jgi:hypothetical protein
LPGAGHPDNDYCTRCNVLFLTYVFNGGLYGKRKLGYRLRFCNYNLIGYKGFLSFYYMAVAYSSYAKEKVAMAKKPGK